MNPWQVIRQLQFTIRQRTWPDAGQSVFASGAVVISAGVAEDALDLRRFPLVVIKPMDARADDDNPSLLTQNYGITLAVAVAGDDLGERTLLGSNRPAVTRSEGRGLMEVEEELLNAVRLNESEDGIKVFERWRSAAEAAEVVEFGHVVTRQYVVEAVTTLDRFYHPARKFATTVAAPNVTLTWALPPNRYDRQEMILRRASGSTPPSTPTSGTGIPLSGPLATTVVDAPGSGTFSYALFAGYDENAAATSDRFSDAVTKTVTV